MHSRSLFISLFSLAALVLHTSAHSVILSTQGDKPGSPIGQALGVDPSTPRNGATVVPHQRDTTFFDQGPLDLWEGCGQTMQSGVLDIKTLTKKLAKQGQIAKASPGGYLYMVLHQINGSGNGPYICGIDETGAGTSYSPLTVTRQVPGNSPTLNTVVTTQFPFQVAMPADLKCTGSYGGMKHICMVRCQNSATSGPYGACIPVQMK